MSSEQNAISSRKKVKKDPGSDHVQGGLQEEQKHLGTTHEVPKYNVSPFEILDYIKSFLIGFTAGFAILYIYYKILPLAFAGSFVIGAVYIIVAEQKAMQKRKFVLRTQFKDLLESMSVALRAGNPLMKALESALDDLQLIYSKDADIIIELNVIISKFNNSVPLSESFADFAERSGLEDIRSFASIYATIEGKSGRTDEIVRDVQQIITDKMVIEIEIETLMTAAKSEVTIMLFMPLLILAIIGYMGAGFMDAIYTTTIGRVVSTFGLLMFIVSYYLAQRFSKIKL